MRDTLPCEGGRSARVRVFDGRDVRVYPSNHGGWWRRGGERCRPARMPRSAGGTYLQGALRKAEMEEAPFAPVNQVGERYSDGGQTAADLEMLVGCQGRGEETRNLKGGTLVATARRSKVSDCMHCWASFLACSPRCSFSGSFRGLSSSAYIPSCSSQ